MFTRGYRANRHTFWQSAADHFRWSNETIGGAPGKSLSWGLHILSGKHHKFSWVNQLFLWPFSIAMLNYQRVTPMSLGFMVDIPILIEVFFNQQTSLGGHNLVPKNWWPTMAPVQRRLVFTVRHGLQKEVLLECLALRFLRKREGWRSK